MTSVLRDGLREWRGFISRCQRVRMKKLQCRQRCKLVELIRQSCLKYPRSSWQSTRHKLLNAFALLSTFRGTFCFPTPVSTLSAPARQTDFYECHLENRHVPSPSEILYVGRTNRYSNEKHWMCLGSKFFGGATGWIMSLSHLQHA